MTENATVSSPVNKSAEIRKALAHLGPAARPADVIAHLAANGVTVGNNAISNVIAYDRKRAGDSKPAVNGHAAGAAGPVIDNPAEVVLMVKGLIATLGGKEALKRLIDVL